MMTEIDGQSIPSVSHALNGLYQSQRTVRKARLLIMIMAEARRKWLEILRNMLKDRKPTHRSKTRNFIDIITMRMLTVRIKEIRKDPVLSLRKGKSGGNCARRDSGRIFANVPFHIGTPPK
jgi:hypothetical protein